MSDDRTLALTRAYELIEAGKPDEARVILDSILEVEKNNADAWWIYAHAVDEPVAARDALENVLQLNPQYPGAGELLVVLREQYPDLPPSAIERRAVPKMPSDLPDTPVEEEYAEPDFLDEEEAEPSSVTVREAEPATSRGGVLPWVAVAALAVIVVLALFLILSSINQGAVVDATETPAPVVGVPTDDVSGGVSVPTPETFEVQSEVTLEVTPLAEATADVETTPEIMAVPSVEVTVEVLPLPTDEPAGEVTQAVLETLPTDEAASVVVEETAEVLPAPTDDMSGMGEEVTVEPVAEATADVVLEVTADPEVTEAPVPETTADAGAQTTGFEALSASLTGFALPDSAFRQQTTSLGETIVASVCTRPGLDLRSDLVQSLSQLSQAGDSIADVDAIAVEMVDCVSNVPLRLVGVLLSDTARFASGELNDDQYQGLWRAL